MSDIVERLRGRTMGAVEWVSRAPDLCIEAADEIDRLRDEITVDEQRVADLMGDVQRQGLENEKLRGLLRESFDGLDDYWVTRRRLMDFAQTACQRGARMQVMRDYLTQYSGQSTTLWRDFCRVCPEAAGWFDDEGVPR